MVTVHRCYGMMKVYKIRKENGMEQTINFTKKKHVGGEGNRDFFPAVLSLLFADCQNGWGRSEFLAASTESGNADQLMHGALRRDVCIFIPVYGLTLSMKSKYPEYDFDGHTATLFVLKRYVKLVLTFLVPFVFCVGVTFVTDTSRYPAGMFANIISIIMDFFGVGHMFGGRMLVSTWWYLSLEVLLISFLPVALQILQKIQLAYCDAVPSSRQFPDRKACTSDKISFYRTACDMFC